MDRVEPTQIKVKQLFYQMKEFFPDVPDTAVKSCLQQAGFEKEEAESLLVIEAQKYSKAPTSKKMSYTQPRFHYPPGSTIVNHTPNSIFGPTSPTQLAPAIPVTPPAARQSVNSALYSPSIDLSLPLQNDQAHQLTENKQGPQVKLIYGQPRSTTSVNVIVKSPTDQLPRVTCTKVPNSPNGSQVQITIRPQGVQRNPFFFIEPLSPTRAAPTSPMPHMPAQEIQTERVEAQCKRRELLRRLLEESRQEVSLLFEKVGELQKKLALQKKEHGGLIEFSPSAALYDFKRLKKEIYDLESECQAMIRDLEPCGQTDRALALIRGNSSVIPNGQPTTVGEKEDALWSCNYCTFFNHPEMVMCEQCEKPRSNRSKTDLANDASVSLHSLQPYAYRLLGVVEVGAAVIPFTGQSNIRIQVRHRPRTVQGWVL